MIVMGCEFPIPCGALTIIGANPLPSIAEGVSSSRL